MPTETALHFEGDGITPKTIPTSEFLSVAAAFFECISKELANKLGQKVKIYGFETRPGSAVALAFVETAESDLEICTQSVAQKISDPNCNEETIKRLRSVAEQYIDSKHSISATAGKNVINLNFPSHEKHIPIKKTELTTIQVEVRGIWDERGKFKTEVYSIESDELLKLNVTEETAKKLGKSLFGRGYISAKLETAEGGSTTGEVLSFNPCDPTITWEDIENTFRRAFRDIGVREFLLAERGDSND